MNRRFAPLAALVWRPCCAHRRPRRRPAPGGSSTRSRTSAGSACSRSRSARSGSPAPPARPTRRTRPRRSVSAALPFPDRPLARGVGAGKADGRDAHALVLPQSRRPHHRPWAPCREGPHGLLGRRRRQGLGLARALLHVSALVLDRGAARSRLPGGRRLDIAWTSELDPAWLDDELSFLLNPEAALFANLPAQAACAADCAAASAGLPLDPMFWCAGCQGGMYPLTGNVAAHVGGVQASLLAAQRLVYRLHRRGSPGAPRARPPSARATRCRS